MYIFCLDYVSAQTSQPATIVSSAVNCQEKSLYSHLSNVGVPQQPIISQHHVASDMQSSNAVVAQSTVTCVGLGEQSVIASPVKQGQEATIANYSAPSYQCSSAMSTTVTSRMLLDSTLIMSSPAAASGTTPFTGHTVIGPSAAVMESTLCDTGSVLSNVSVLPTSGGQECSASTPNFVISEMWTEHRPSEATIEQPEDGGKIRNVLPLSHGDAGYVAISQLSTSSPEEASNTVPALFSQQSAALPSSYALHSPSFTVTPLTTSTICPDGDRFGALMSELQAFNQQGHTIPMAPNGSLPNVPGIEHQLPSTTMAHTYFSKINDANDALQTQHVCLPGNTFGMTQIKRDPAELSINIAASVLQRSLESSISEFSMPFTDTHMGAEEQSNSEIHHKSNAANHLAPQNNTYNWSVAASVVGPESVVIETSMLCRLILCILH